MPASPPTAFWDDLLEYIEDRRVIPIVGAELLRAPAADGGEPVSLYTVLAARLAERLGVPADDLPEDDALNAVICRHLGRGGRREDIYPRLRAALKEAPLPVPPALRKLAAIRHFDLFVTTTFDTLLEQAINDARGPDAARAQIVVYAPNNVQDLPRPLNLADPPAVYHMLGRASAAPDYAVTEEDVLEFLCALQSGRRRPDLLFDELKAKHLLLIGNRFPDWLARFFIRLAKGGRLSGQRDSSEILADRVSHRDANLTLFLRNFSYGTQVYEEGGAIEFVDELVGRYIGRNPAEALHGLPPVSPTSLMLPGSVFLSYAREDESAVKLIRQKLEAVGIDAWYDRERLEGGDDYALKIRRNIKSCSLFIPLISISTQARVQGFFRREWNLAADRAQDFAQGVPFIVPICIDDTSEADAIVPEAFLDAQWTRLPQGVMASDFAQRIVNLVRETRRRERGLI
jgi:hypothetical protein